MAQLSTVWGIDIGQCALKAIKLRNLDGELRLEAFDVIEHPKILSQPEADREQLVRLAMEQFLARNNLAGCGVVVTAPGQSGFYRFVKLPPVEAKQVPQLVKFEAKQQIPINLDEVIWRWQAFVDPDSPDVEVGIFAVKRTDLVSMLERFGALGIQIDAVQMAPLALYNAVMFDEQAAAQGATLIVDVGAESTNLVVADGPRIWTRSFQPGGNAFTEALVKAFKLSFAKAEKLKRTAATSKYAKNIFVAMRPVFADLVQKIQQSIGFYTSLHRDSRFVRLIGLGNGFRLPGLLKFLEQNLSLPAVRPDTYNKIAPSAAANAPAFTENVLSFAVAYGLALQGLGLGKIRTNLLPGEVAKKRLWAAKRPWFAASAAALVLAFGGISYRAWRDQGRLAPEGNAVLEQAQTVLQACQNDRDDYAKVRGLDQAELEKISKYLRLAEYRDVWPTMGYLVNDAIKRIAEHQPLMNLEEWGKLPKQRGARKVVVVESLRAEYRDNVAGETEASLRAGGGLSPGGGPTYGNILGEPTGGGAIRRPGPGPLCKGHHPTVATETLARRRTRVVCAVNSWRLRNVETATCSR